MYRTKHKRRLSQQDARYGNSLVNGAAILSLFEDAATELLVMLDGDEGLFRTYEYVDFFSPLYAGDFIEIESEIIQVNPSSRKLAFHCYKIIEARKDIGSTAADALPLRQLVTKAVGICVVPKNKQRKEKSLAKQV